MRAQDYLCLSLDLEDKNQIKQCVDELSDLVGYFKINSAFTLFGPSLISYILERRAKVFLDIKLHDIPASVANYSAAVTKLGVDIVTIHIAGGSEMMTQAVKKAQSTAQRLGTLRPKLIGITLLTSIDREMMNSELNIQGDLVDEISRKSNLAAESGLDGIVCSASELPLIRQSLPKHFYYVTPGVRSIGETEDDHRRIVSCSDAIRAGSDLLVVGRPILRAGNRQAATRKILQEIEAEL